MAPALFNLSKNSAQPTVTYKKKYIFGVIVWIMIRNMYLVSISVLGTEV